LLVLASMVLLVVVQGLMDLRYTSQTGGGVSQLGRVVIVGSAAAHGMMDALTELEAGLSAGQTRPNSPGDALRIRQQGQNAFQEFRRCLDAAARATRSGMAISPAKPAESGPNSAPSQLAQLQAIERTLDAVQLQWQDYTNRLETSPARAESIRDSYLLPALNEKLRPALTVFCQSLERESLEQAQSLLRKSERSQRIIILLEVVVALMVLAAGFWLIQSVWLPVERLARAAREVAGGNRQCRVPPGRPDEFGAMAGAFNHMLDVLESTTVSRDELEKTVRDRTAQLTNENNVRRAIETELRAGEKYLTIILNSIADGVLVTNAEGRVLRLNPVAEQLTGWKTVEALSRPVNEIFRVIDEQTRQPLPVPVAEIVAENKTTGVAAHAILVDRAGAEHPVSDHYSPIRDLNGTVLGVVLVFRDVTDDRRAEEQIVKLNRELEQRVESRTSELRESERRHRTLLANLQGMAYRCRNNRDWTMEFLSDGCRDLLGIEPVDIVSGRICYNDLIHPEDREPVWDQVQSALAAQKAFTLEYRVKHAGGRWRSVLEQGRAVLGDHGQVTALEGYITDITGRVDAERERRILEDQVRRAQKMEAIGTLAGGIAHDFNNVLAAILGSAELIKMDMPADHPSREFLGQIFVAGQRAREVVQQILTFSQRRESERNIIHLFPVVKECVKLLRSTIPAMVDITFRVDPECAPVLADPTQIHQVIMNLCTNAWQALPENGGNIKVTVEMCDVDEKARERHPDLQTATYVRLSVADNGSGMEQATLDRIFEPFFTTKPVGEGSGLGLSVVHGIVKAHQGVITVESQPGKGTVFHIYLPPQKVDPAETPEETPAIHGGNQERILFVEDDELAGWATQKILKKFNYRVEWFTHPGEALAKFRAAPANFDLVLSDLAMPEMTGDDLAAALLKIRPDIPIVLMTGMIDPVIQKQARHIGVCGVLLKPVDAASLGLEIARHLAERNGI